MKQNVNNKLAFGKATVTELNDAQLTEVNGGSLLVSLIVSAITITIMEN